MQSEKVHGRDTCRFIANKSDTEQNAFPEVQKNSTCIFEVAVGLPSLAHGFSHAGWCGCRKLCLRSQLLLRACFFNTGLSSFVYARRATMLMLALCRTLGIIVVTNFVAFYLVGNTLLDSTYATCPSFCCAMFVAVAILLLPQLAIECGSLMALLFGTFLLLT